MGFGSLMAMKVDGVPTNLGYYVVDQFDPDSMHIEHDHGFIEVNAEKKIHKLTGLRSGGRYIFETTQFNSQLYMDWKLVYNNKSMRASDISSHIISSRLADLIFWVDFVVLLVNILFETYPNGVCKTTIIQFILSEQDIASIDWCGYLFTCLKNCKNSWKKDDPNSAFTGPVTILSLLYLYYTDFSEFHFPHQFPAISSWNIKSIRLRESAEIESGGSGRCRVLEDIDLEAQQSKEHLVELVNRFEKTKDEKVQLRFDILKALEVEPDIVKLKDLLKDFDEEYGGQDEVDQKEPETPVQNNNLFDIPIDYDLTSSQLDLAVNNCIQVEKQLEYEKSFIPRFDLGDINKEEDEKVISKKNVGNKRPKKDSALVRSPFIESATSLSLKLTVEEERVSNRLFALMGDANEAIFKTASGKGTFRQHFESFLSPSWLYSSVIDIWCHFLNLDNKRKADTSPYRYFLSIGSLFPSISTESMPDFFKNTRLFTNGIHEDMKNKIELHNFKNIDLVFFPIHQNGHYYCFCYDLRKPAIICIDNA